MQASAAAHSRVVDAVVGADALADLVGAAFQQLAHEMGIGDMGAGHRHHVHMALGHGAGRGRDVPDSRGMEDGNVGLRLDGAGEVEERRRRKGHVGQHAHRAR